MRIGFICIKARVWKEAWEKNLCPMWHLRTYADKKHEYAIHDRRILSRDSNWVPTEFKKETRSSISRWFSSWFSDSETSTENVRVFHHVFPPFLHSVNTSAKNVILFVSDPGILCETDAISLTTCTSLQQESAVWRCWGYEDVSGQEKHMARWMFLGFPGNPAHSSELC
jgi:hypothetical protein